MKSSNLIAAVTYALAFALLLPASLMGQSVSKLMLEHSTDMQTWQAVPMTPEMLDANGELIFQNNSAQQFFRMRVNVLQLPNFTTQPASNTAIGEDESATLSVNVTGVGLSYQWYSGQSGDTSQPIDGATSSSYNTGALTDDATYWVRVTNAVGAKDSGTLAVTINRPPTIASQPTSQTIIAGSSATLTVSATGSAPFTFQWYLGNLGATTVPVGINSPTLTTPALTVTTKYWVKITNAFGEANSSSVTVTVQANTAPTISDIAAQSISADSNTGAIAFTIGDAQTVESSLTLSGSSSNTTLVPNASIVFGGSGASRTVTVTPASSQSGTATITVTVSDGSLTASDTFVLTVVNALAPAELTGNVRVVYSNDSYGPDYGVEYNYYKTNSQLVFLDFEERSLNDYTWSSVTGRLTDTSFEEYTDYTYLTASKGIFVFSEGSTGTFATYDASWDLDHDGTPDGEQIDAGILPKYPHKQLGIATSGSSSFWLSNEGVSASDLSLAFSEQQIDVIASGNDSWGIVNATYVSESGQIDTLSWDNDWTVDVVILNSVTVTNGGTDSDGGAINQAVMWLGLRTTATTYNTVGLLDIAIQNHNGIKRIRADSDDLVDFNASLLDPPVGEVHIRLSYNSNEAELTSTYSYDGNQYADLSTSSVAALQSYINRDSIAVELGAESDYVQIKAGENTFKEFKVTVVPTGFALIPAGNFTMGDSLDGDSYAPQVTVNVSAFLMGKNEVTKALWDEVRTWGQSNGYTDLAVGAGKATNHPVQTISWWDVVKWCNARSQKEGLTPVYTVSGAVMKTGTTAPVANWSANGYRLPTEAEWEKAARGGLSGKRFPWGDTISHSQANYVARSEYSYDLSGSVNNFHPSYTAGGFPYTSPVGSFVANAYGLHDMAGNVWEWCWDWYAESTYSSGATDPRGANSGSLRVIRGGGWLLNAIGCRVAGRGGNGPTYQGDGSFGFRVARSSVP